MSLPLATRHNFLGSSLRWQGDYVKEKLYVGNLWFEATATELKEWFGPIETVRIVADRTSP